jgi:iron complex outermembrane receptor protein
MRSSWSKPSRHGSWTRGLLLTTALASVASAGAAAAQEEGQVEEVVVTGTRIRGIDPIGSSVLSVGRDEIQKAPVASATDILRQLPMSSALGADEGTSNGGTSVQGASFNNTYSRAANLRGLGTTATLVLIDGHRVAPQGQTGQINDLDLIPALAIERVEVVADGASALYGSDAIAGVINLVLRKRFNGATVTARYGVADDYNQALLSGIVGRQWKTGSFMLTYEHTRRSRLAASDRPELYSDDFSPYGGSLPPQLSSPGNVLIGGVPYGVPAGQNGSAVTLGSLSRTVNRTSAWAGVDALPQQTRNTVLATFSQELTSRVKLFGEGLFTRREFERNNVAAVSSGNGFNVPSTNPFSPCAPGRSTANTLGIACPAKGTLAVQYSFLNDLGPGLASGKQEVWSLRSGVDVDLGHDWKANLAGGYSRSKDVSFVDNGINTNAVTAAITGTATVTVNGVPTTVTRPASVPALNLFCGGTACNSPATLDYIRGYTYRPATYDYQYASGGVDGPLFSLPGGEVRLAAGFDLRDDKLTSLNRVNTSTPTNATFIDVLNVSKRKVTSFYGELYVPIFGASNARAGFQRLALSLAARTEKYSDFGRTTNPKVGLTWRPMEGLDLHASYGTSFRAPTLADINPAIAAVNRSNALTAQQAQALGLGNVSTLNFISTTGGTLGIQPEDATTYSVGVDYRPTWLSGLQVSVNYYNMEYRNRIDQPVQNVGAINALLGAPLYDSLITYNPLFYGNRSGLSQAEFNARLQEIFTSTTPTLTGAVPAVTSVVAIARGNKANTGTLNTSGLDLNVSYTFDTSMGTWRIGGQGQYVFEYLNSIVPTQAAEDLVNVFSAVGSPMRFKGRATVSWQKGGWSANGFVNYTNGYNIPRTSIPATAPAKYLKVASHTTVDATLSYQFQDDGPWSIAKGVTVQLSAQNLFDNQAPFMINNGTVPLLFDNSNASPIGRIIAFQISKTW